MRRPLRAPLFAAIASCVLLLLLLWCARADACGGGFSRRKPDGSVALTYNDAWRAVLMRVGQRTVLTLQNSYQGPLEDFALVVPVPVLLERANVRTLPAGLLERIDRLSSPRLLELFERNPCEMAELQETADSKEGDRDERPGRGGLDGRGARARQGGAEFSVDEYDVVVLSATESTALQQWLLDHGYGIPAGAEPYLRPYVDFGMKFFVAKVNVSRVRFRWGRAVLSPLRFHYDTPTLVLGTRLGLVNSSGVQDLVVYVLGEERYETSNYQNVFIPTNLAIREEAGAEFDSFYASLFDQAAARRGIVVTEYAAPATVCELCPDGAAPLSAEDLSLLGADVAGTPRGGFVLTRLHARYGKETLGEDPVFRSAPPVRGGSEPWSKPDRPRAAQPAATNDFQARYIVRHRWTGALDCAGPVFGAWSTSSDRPRSPRAVATPVRRDLDAETLVLDAGQEAHTGDAPGLERRLASLGASLFATRSERASWSCLALGVAAMTVAVFARRRKRRVLPNLGVFVLAVALCLAASMMAREPRLLSGVDRVGRRLADALSDPLVLLALACGAAGVVSARRRATLLLSGLLPLFGGLVASWLAARADDAWIAGEVFDLATSARVAAEGASELLEPAAVGCLWAGLLLTLAAIVSARELCEARGGKALAWATAPVVGLAIAGRSLLWGRLGVVDGLVVVAILAAAVVTDRARRRLAQAPAIGVALVAAVVLLDFAARLHLESAALGAISGQSVDPVQRARILGAMVSGDRVRVEVVGLDAALVSALVVVRGRGAWAALRSKEAIGVSLASAIGAALAMTVLSWTGFAERIEAVGRVASRVASTDGSRAVRSAADPERAATLDLGGPSLAIEGADLLGADRFAADLVPYGPELVARIASEGGTIPLLVAPARAPMATVVSALAPLLSQQQTDFRLAPRVDPRADLGVYGLLVAATEAHATPIELVVSPTLHAPAPDAIRGMGFVLDGTVLRAFGLRRDATGFSRGDAPAPTKLDLQGSGGGDVAYAIVGANADEVAVLAAAPDTPVETVGRALDRITSLRASRSDGRAMGATGIFRSVVLTTARATVEALRLGT